MRSPQTNIEQAGSAVRGKGRPESISGWINYKEEVWHWGGWHGVESV